MMGRKQMECDTDQQHNEMTCKMTDGKRAAVVQFKMTAKGPIVMREKGDMDLSKEIKKHVGENVNIHAETKNKIMSKNKGREDTFGEL